MAKTACVAGGHLEHENDCPKHELVSLKYYKVVLRNFDIYAGKKSCNVVLAALDGCYVNCEMYFHLDSHCLKQRVLINTGVEELYINPKIVAKFGYPCCEHAKPYFPVGADGRLLPQVTHQAAAHFGFGNHVKICWLDIMELGELEFVLGRNWISYHNPIICASLGYYPEFDRDICCTHRAVSNDDPFKDLVCKPLAGVYRCYKEVKFPKVLRIERQTDVSDSSAISWKVSSPVTPVKNSQLISLESTQVSGKSPSNVRGDSTADIPYNKLVSICDDINCEIDLIHSKKLQINHKLISNNNDTNDNVNNVKMDKKSHKNLQSVNIDIIQTLPSWYHKAVVEDLDNDEIVQKNVDAIYINTGDGEHDIIDRDDNSSPTFAFMEKPAKRRTKKKNKQKKYIYSILSNQDKTKCILIIRHASTVVHVVADIRHGHHDTNKYWAAYVYPAMPTFTSVSVDMTADPPKIPPKYEDLKAAFSDGVLQLPEHGPHDLSIDLQDGKIPAMGPLYNMSEAESKIVNKYVKDMTAKGLIRPSTSPCGAPILFAKKKDGSLRLCADYRRLNDITVKSVYLLPLIPEMLDRLADASIFSSLDLKDSADQKRR